MKKLLSYVFVLGGLGLACAFSLRAQAAEGNMPMPGIAPAPGDKALPTPYQEAHSSGSISPEDNAKGDATIVNPITHPGEYALSAKHSDLSKT